MSKGFFFDSSPKKEKGDELNNPWVLYFDGACWPNPGGIATYGWLLYSPDGNLVGEKCGFVCEGDGATNNVSEFAALLKGLEYFQSEGLSGDLLCKGDSQLVINMASGKWGGKKPHLIKLKKETRKIMGKIKGKVKLEWIAREANSEADELSKAGRTRYLKTKGKRNPHSSA